VGPLSPPPEPLPLDEVDPDPEPEPEPELEPELVELAVPPLLVELPPPPLPLEEVPLPLDPLEPPDVDASGPPFTVATCPSCAQPGMKTSAVVTNSAQRTIFMIGLRTRETARAQP
jgi:protein TonB